MSNNKKAIDMIKSAPGLCGHEPQTTFDLNIVMPADLKPRINNYECAQPCSPIGEAAKVRWKYLEVSL